MIAACCYLLLFVSVIAVVVDRALTATRVLNTKRTHSGGSFMPPTTSHWTDVYTYVTPQLHSYTEIHMYICVFMYVCKKMCAYAQRIAIAKSSVQLQ